MLLNCEHDVRLLILSNNITCMDICMTTTDLSMYLCYNFLLLFSVWTNILLGHNRLSNSPSGTKQVSLLCFICSFAKSECLFKSWMSRQWTMFIRQGCTQQRVYHQLSSLRGVDWKVLTKKGLQSHTQHGALNSSVHSTPVLNSHQYKE